MAADKGSTTRKRISVELLLGISATFLSLCALVVSVLQTNIARQQTQIAREQQQASAWPHLQAEFTKTDQSFDWSLINNGVGPAIIGSVQITHRGKSYDNPAELVNQQLQQISRVSSLKAELFYSSINSGDVVKNDDRLQLVREDKNPIIADSLLAMIQDSSYHFRVVYHDVYNNCWLLNYTQGKSQVTALSDCPNQ